MTALGGVAIKCRVAEEVWLRRYPFIECYIQIVSNLADVPQNTGMMGNVVAKPLQRNSSGADLETTISR
jgi:hypothetical protein